MIIALGALFGVILKFQNHNGRSYDCVGANCADVSTTSGLPSNATMNSMMPEHDTTIATASTLGADCIPVGWNYKGDLITTDQPYFHLTVDHDSNVYVAHEKLKSLDKWSSQGTLLKRLYQYQFDIDTPLFFHLSSQSLYFCQVWNRSLHIFKITDDNWAPESVIGDIINKLGVNPSLNHCGGLYVNSAGDIFMLMTSSGAVYKWTVNSSSAILVVDGSKIDSVRYPTTNIVAFAVYEPDNTIYLLDRGASFQKTSNGSFVNVGYGFNRILKYSNGSELGETIIDGTPLHMFSNTKAVDVDAYTIAVDQTGYVILGELHRVSIWSPDGKFHSTIMNKYRIHES
ncbi:unnamed protein product, partial [Adineta ricciae]